MPIGKIEDIGADRNLISVGDTKVVEGIQVSVGGVPFKVERVTSRDKVKPQDRNNNIELAKQMTIDLQAQMDIPVSRLSDLSLDDPDRTTDPARGEEFWREVDGVTWLYNRIAIVEILHDGTNFYLKQRRP